jgi:hypothetical protein
LREIYESLRNINVPEDKALNVLIAFEERFLAFNQKLNKIENTQTLHSWMLGFTLAILVALLIKAIR